MTVMKFSTEEEAIQLANCVKYGLAAAVWTENNSVAHRVALELQAGLVWINCWMIRDLRVPLGGWKVRVCVFAPCALFTEAAAAV